MFITPFRRALAVLISVLIVCPLVLGANCIVISDPFLGVRFLNCPEEGVTVDAAVDLQIQVFFGVSDTQLSVDVVGNASLSSESPALAADPEIEDVFLSQVSVTPIGPGIVTVSVTAEGGVISGSSDSSECVMTVAFPCTSDDECDDGDACTADACVQNVCQHEADTELDDGLFCNGEETCHRETGETLHSGDPCELEGEAPICSEEEGRCVQCKSDEDCGDGLQCFGGFCFAE